MRGLFAGLRNDLIQRLTIWVNELPTDFTDLQS